MSFPPVNGHWLGLIAIIPLLSALHQAPSSLKSRCIYGLKLGSVFGMVYMGLTNIWVFTLIDFSSLTKISFLYGIYTLYSALFFVLLCVLFCCIGRSFAIFPFFWVLVEWLRASGNFGTPNGVVGYAFSSAPLLNTYASIGGVYGLSFIIILVNVCLFVLFQKRHQLRRLSFTNLSLWPILLIAGIFTFPLFITFSSHSIPSPLSVGIIQGNHAQLDKLDKAKRPLIQKDYLDLTKTALEQQSVDLIIWPETFSPNLNLRQPQFMDKSRALSHTYDTALLFGSPRYENGHYFNSAILLQGQTQSFYDKVSLMPFGEYWPWKSLFKRFNLSNLIPGSEYTPGMHLFPLPFQSHFLGIGICLETTYPEHFRSLALANSTCFISLVNNAWFKTSSIAQRQFQMLVIRALETGRPIIQAANTGISCIISASGTVSYASQLNTQAIYMDNIPSTIIHTPFLRIGNAIVLLSFGVIILMGIRQFFQRFL